MVMRWWRRQRKTDETRLGIDGDIQFTSEAVAEIQRGAEAGDPEAMANWGGHLGQHGHLREGIQWSERAWQAGNLAAGFNLGTFHERAGDTHLADLVWTEVAGAGDPDAMMCVARLALRRGDRAAADSWLEPVLKQDQPYPVTSLGVAYREYGDLDTALRLFDRAIAMGDGYAMEYAADIYEYRGDAVTAAKLRKQAATARRYGWGPADN